MAGESVISLNSIFSFFLDDPSSFKKGENSFRSQHVYSINYDGELRALNAQVCPSMKDKLYDVQILFNVDGEVEEASCNCPVGKKKCHHMASALFYAHYNVSITDQSCRWVQKKPDSKNVMTIDEMFKDPAKQPYSATSHRLSDADKEKLYEDLVSSFGHHVSIAWYLSPEPSVTELQLHNLEQTLFSSDLREAANKGEHLSEKVKVSPSKVMDVEHDTRGQSSNPNWLICRRFLITASNFNKVLKSCKSNSYSPSLFKCLLGTYDLSGVKQVAYGNAKESEARKEFEQHFKVQVKLCGLFLHSSGLIGASPDGIIVRTNPDSSVTDDELLEIKCPYSMRNEEVPECIKSKSNSRTIPSKQYIVVYDDRGSFVVNKNHPYYDQIQGQLHLTNRNRCFLLIWSRLKSLVVTIDKDESWKPNIDTLINFYLSQFLPHILRESDG